MGIRLHVYSPYDKDRDGGWDGTILTDVYEPWDCLEHLCKEVFENSFEPSTVTAATLRERLPRAMTIVREKTKDRRNHGWMQNALRRFVEVAEELEEDHGSPVAICLC